MPKETLERVVQCLATVTRYPTQLLAVDADLENDLGIDSVKRVEIIVALSEAFEIELRVDEADTSIRTIGDIVAWIESVLIHNEADHSEDRRTTTESPPRIVQDSAPPHAAEALPEPHFPVRDNHRPDHDGKPLRGRVALVTGSGRGVGRTIARVLADRGAHVVVNSFHSRDQGEQTVDEIIVQGGSAAHCWGSVANPEHVDRIFNEIEAQSGQLDILVCNASDGKIGSLLDLAPDDWDRAFRTNVAGHHQCALRAADLMRPRGGGSIVTMSAVGAHQFIDGLGSQGVVKAAVETLTRYLACELGRVGIRVNCVAGGPVYGELLSRFPAAQTKQHHWESMTPDGSLCSPMDLAETIAFLVSDAARGINGAVWMVDHGFSANADGQPLNNASRQTAIAARKHENITRLTH